MHAKKWANKLALSFYFEFIHYKEILRSIAIILQYLHVIIFFQPFITVVYIIETFMIQRMVLLIVRRSGLLYALLKRKYILGYYLQFQAVTSAYV
ncbi:MAG: hypothetical protein WBY28_12050, partial [Nitrososphaeraceae archaeon]